MTLFSKENLARADFHQQLVQYFVKGFHDSSDKLQTAKMLLADCLEDFCSSCKQPIAFNFADFLSLHLVGKRETQRFLSALLYGLYYRDIDFTRLISANPNEHIQYLLMQILAETVSGKRLHTILKRLSLDQIASLICYIHRHYREGSYIISNQLHIIYHDNKPLLALLKGLNDHYLNSTLLLNLLSLHRSLDINTLTSLVESLQEDAKKQVAVIYDNLPNLIQMMAESPVKVVKYLESMKEEKNPHSPEILDAEKTSEKFLQLFGFFLQKPLTLLQYETFFEVFGLYSHQPPLSVIGVEISESLLDKIQALTSFFAHPGAQLIQPKQELNNHFTFIYNLCYHLNTFHYYPERYTEGLDLLTFALPTKDKNLSKLPWIPTLLKGLDALSSHLKQPIHDYPIFIFDQAQGRRFAHNKLFLDSLKPKNGTLIHISQEETVALANKLHLEKLIQTTDEGSFGYGGARNAIFFLAPLLRAAFKQKKSLHDVLEMHASHLKTLFHDSVLESPSIVHMGEDDLELPQTCPFSDLLFAQSHRKEYFVNITYISGRTTMHANPQIDLKSLLESPESLYLFTQWSDRPTLKSMTAHIGKPRFCLNVPFAYEEQHFRRLLHYYDPFRLSIRHLAGTRYPLPHIPIDPLDGLDAPLPKILTYMFQLGMIQSLLDPANSKERCALPWNLFSDPSIPTFSSLKEALAFVSQDSTKREMQKRFWKNINDLLSPDLKNSFMIGRDLEGFQQNIEETLAFYKHQHSFSLHTIGSIYKQFRKDAELLEELLKRIHKEISVQVPIPALWYEACQNLNLHAILETIRVGLEKEKNISLKDWSLTYGLYRLLNVVGAGEFCEDVKALLSGESKLVQFPQ